MVKVEQPPHSDPIGLWGVRAGVRLTPCVGPPVGQSWPFAQELKATVLITRRVASTPKAEPSGADRCALLRRGMLPAHSCQHACGSSFASSIHFLNSNRKVKKKDITICETACHGGVDPLSRTTNLAS